MTPIRKWRGVVAGVDVTFDAPMEKAWDKARGMPEDWIEQNDGPVLCEPISVADVEWVETTDKLGPYIRMVNSAKMRVQLIGAPDLTGRKSA